MAEKDSDKDVKGKATEPRASAGEQSQPDPKNAPPEGTPENPRVLPADDRIPKEAQGLPMPPGVASVDGRKTETEERDTETKETVKKTTSTPTKAEEKKK